MKRLGIVADHVTFLVGEDITQPDHAECAVDEEALKG